MLGIVALGLIVMAALAAGWLAYRSRLQLAADKAAREAKEEARVAAVRAHAELTRAIGVAEGRLAPKVRSSPGRSSSS